MAKKISNRTDLGYAEAVDEYVENMKILETEPDTGFDDYKQRLYDRQDVLAEIVDKWESLGQTDLTSDECLENMKIPEAEPHTGVGGHEDQICDRQNVLEEIKVLGDILEKEQGENNE